MANGAYTLKRTTFTNKSTGGELWLDGKFVCYTLEDVDRALERVGQTGKVKGETAIPQGSYIVELTLSQRFKKVLPLSHNVPYFEGVRIHSGNTAADTEGCVLVGLKKGVDAVGESRAAMVIVMQQMEELTKAGKGIRIRVTNATSTEIEGAVK